MSAVLEKQVIQAIWQESRAFGAKHGAELLGRTGLTEEDFTHPTTRGAFGSICASLAQNSQPTASGKTYDWLEADVVQPEVVPAIADLIKLASTRRKALLVAKEIMAAAQDESLSEADLLARLRLAAEIDGRSSNWRALSVDLPRLGADIRAVCDGRKSASVKTGFREIDEATGGLPATLVVIAAMPGVGKSSFEAAIIRNAAKEGVKTAIFSMEDRADWLLYRLLAEESGVHQVAIRRGNVESKWDDIGRGVSRLETIAQNILIDDREGLTASETLFAARDAIRRGAKAIFLDNMTAMSFERGPRMDLEIQDFLRRARGLANETGVPFVVLSHVRRREGLDVDQVPLLTDCTETSAFEKLSRVAYGLARNKKTNEMTVAVLKNTNGKSWDKIKLQLKPSSALVEEIP